MKKNKILMIGILAAIVLINTGCGGSEYIKKGKEAVKYEETGQNIQNNILCKPVDEELYNLYEEYSEQLITKLDDLPSCEEFKPSDIEYHSIWETIVIKPLAWVILKVGQFLGNYGISVMLIGLLIRIILLPFSKNTIKQSENMKKMKPELDRIEKKYANKKDQQSQYAKSQETMMIYKKYNVSMLGGCLPSLIQIPLFFGFLQAINRVPAIFEDTLWGLKLGMTPAIGLANQQYIYIVLMAVVIITTYLSFKQTMKSQDNSDTMKQMNMMLQIMVVLMAIASFSLATAVALYWIVTNAFMVVQNLIIKKLMQKEETSDGKIIKNARVKKTKVNKRG